ncbi:MAG TPA: helix-turn-helix domain-containing protein [Pseudonocardia sp.]|uniref:PucR family transcriptional regulator n=1 Tax=Pseudonocardia sp. TaxID=60912 RepID=UPI002C58D606|nr:helix-turn-helix domain-containing protein [Pseudonocardia sp.]HTF49668.1 helix-turn-helix domain-containing protein [Pseudonocardia sp.]
MADHIAALAGEVARRIAARLADLAPEMTTMFVDTIPEFHHDQAVQRLMVASTTSNLSAVVDMLMLGISLEDIVVPPAAAMYARRFAQHDLSLEALLRAYRLGEHMFLQWAIEDLRRQALPADDALAVTGHVALVLNGYIDRVIEGLIDIYQSERQRWHERSDAAHAAQVRAVLAAEELTTSAAEQMLGLALRGWHTAAVAWVHPDDAAAQLGAVDLLLTEASGRTPMTVYADASTIWAWMFSPSRPSVDVDRLAAQLTKHGQLRIALGEPGTGLAGFRSSHEEALRARQVAEIDARPTQQLYPHAQIALAGLLIDRRDAVRLWVQRTLGELAREDKAMARLRHTVQVLLEANGSYTEAAARMHVHKNTVLYRVRKAEELLGRPVTEDRLPIQVALLACDQLAATTKTPRPDVSMAAVHLQGRKPDTP